MAMVTHLRDRHSLPRRPREGEMAFRATLSSVAATIVDGLSYETWLAASLGHYGVAALFGALFGAVTNFSLNRHWAFVATEGRLSAQVVRYAVVSGLTFLGLRTALWLLIDVMVIDARLAWLPAKVAAFLAVSYPLQRWWVFRGVRG
jgi:putative flippase GtrA